MTPFDNRGADLGFFQLHLPEVVFPSFFLREAARLLGGQLEVHEVRFQTHGRPRFLSEVTFQIDLKWGADQEGADGLHDLYAAVSFPEVVDHGLQKHRAWIPHGVRLPEVGVLPTLQKSCALSLDQRQEEGLMARSLWVRALDSLTF